MRGILAAVFAAMLATSVAAGPASERVFSRAALEQVKTDQLVVYTHKRTGEMKPLDNGEIRVGLELGEDGARQAVVTMGESGQLRPVSKWPASSGNPILPIFLESALRSMAEATGGSQFYIRNRIKEALGTAGEMKQVSLDVDGRTIPATEITFSPFTRDKNRARMGGFADLKLVFVVSEALPGDVVRFVAETGAEGPYKEEITFARLAEAE